MRVWNKYRVCEVLYGSSKRPVVMSIEPTAFVTNAESGCGIGLTPTQAMKVGAELLRLAKQKKAKKAKKKR